MAHDVYISAEEIKNRISQLGEQISRDYQGKHLDVVCVLCGSFVFAADLVRQIQVPQTVSFIGASSYHGGTETSGQVEITLDLKHDIKGREILLVEDIVDTGITLTHLRQLLLKRSPKSLKLASLLHKPSRTVSPVHIDYLGFTIEDHFVIGYGLDYDGRFRELPHIGIYRGE